MDTKTNIKYWEKITSYFSNDLTFDEKESIEKWANEQDDKKLLIEMSTKMKKVEKAEQMYSEQTNLAWNKLHNKIELEQKPELSFLSMHRNFIGIAASIIVLLSVGFGIFKLVQTNLQMNNLQTAYNQSEVLLADGTMIYLNGNSSLVYPIQFKKKNRSVKLVGEAYFDVKPDKKRPFIIETENARIQVLGTSFNVKSSDLDGDVEVLVSSGKVRLQNIQNPEQELILVKGEFASLRNNILQNKPMNDVNYLSWQTKMLNFDKTPLREVIQTLNRTYAVKINLSEENLGELPLTSKYNQLSVDALLDAMCLTFNLNKKIEGEQIVLYSPTP